MYSKLITLMPMFKTDFFNICLANCNLSPVESDGNLVPKRLNLVTEKDFSRHLVS